MRIKLIIAVLLALLLLSSCGSRDHGAAPSEDTGLSASPADTDNRPQISGEASPAPSKQPSPEPTVSPSPTPAQPTDSAFPEGLPTSVENEDGTQTQLRLSTEDKDYMFWYGDGQNAESPVVMDLNGDGTDDTLTIECIHDLEHEEGEWLSYPIQMTLKVGGSKAVFTSKWNNGIALKIMDFNASDGKMDVCVYEAGTDTDGQYHVYSFDGRIISHTISFSTQSPVLTYDSNGHIYYVRYLSYYSGLTPSIDRGPVINALDYSTLTADTYPHSEIPRYITADGVIKDLNISYGGMDYLRKPDTNNYSDNSVTMDFDGDGTDDTLKLEISHFDEPEDSHYNSPIRINMTLNDGLTEKFESTFNDGVYLFIGDFNVSDPYQDIYLFRSNTDVSGSVNIYRYDGQDFYLYASFDMEGTEFTYDGNGKLYYNTFVTDNDTGDMEFVTMAYDYNNNVLGFYNP